MKNYLYVWKNAFKFNGRASRTEFWTFSLVNLLILMLCYLVGGRLLVVVFELLVFLPNTSVSVRRLHDVNKSGWWYFILFIPPVSLLVFYFFISPSDSGRNNYGELSNDGYYY